VRVLIPSPLFSYTDGKNEVDVTGHTLAEVAAALDERFPGLRFRIVDVNGEIRPHIRFWVGTTLARDLSVRVGPDDVVMIVAALSGG
jgi:molybdopterin synthase sulfur carrier subunit